MTDCQNEVYVQWNTGQNGIWWNETCATVLEVFGLPGDRFVSTPTTDYLVFKFKNVKDAALCRILLSERL
jgi:hypothetical protein